MILVKIKLHSFTEKYEQEEEEQNFGGKRGRGMYRNPFAWGKKHYLGILTAIKIYHWHYKFQSWMPQYCFFPLNLILMYDNLP